MSDLSLFLSQNVEKCEEVAYIASKRIKGADGPVEWRLKPVTTEVDEAIRKSCTKQVPAPGGRKGMYTKEVDYDKYLGKLAATCTTYPDLNNAELQNSYGVMGGDALLKVMLLPGEYADYLAKVQEVNGYEVTQQELVDEAKN